MINTHEEAATIVELFEDVLDRYEIILPSPEDAEKEPENTASLYGSTYYDLLSEVESRLIVLTDSIKRDAHQKIISYVFGN